jgi:hypothetical protein
MKNLLFALCISFVGMLSVATVPRAHAQSVYDMFRSDYELTKKKELAKYGIKDPQNDFVSHWRVYGASGGPILDGMGIKPKRILFSASASWLWGLLLLLLCSISAISIWASANASGNSGNIVPSFLLLGLKSVLAMCVFLAPHLFYATTSTVRDAFMMFAQWAMNPTVAAETNAGPPSADGTRSLLANYYSASNLSGPGTTYLLNAIGLGIHNGIDRWTLALAQNGRPSTLQVYNTLVAKLNPIITRSNSGFAPFPFAEFPQGKAYNLADASGGAVEKPLGKGDSFDGLYQPVALNKGYELKSVTTQGQTYSVIVPGASLPDLNVVTTKKEMIDANSYLPGANWDPILTAEFPRLMQYLLLCGNEEPVKKALHDAGFYPLGMGVFTPAVFEQGRALGLKVLKSQTDLANTRAGNADGTGTGYNVFGAIGDEMAADQETKNAFEITEDLHTNLIHYIAMTVAHQFNKSEQRISMAKKIQTQIAAQVSGFVQLSFVEQMKNHFDTGVRNRYKDAMQNNGNNAGLPMRQEDELSKIGKYYQSVAKFVCDPVRRVVIMVCTTWNQLMIELAVLTLWIAAPFWLWDKTAKAFTGVFNTLFTAAMLGPTLAILLTLWDTASGMMLAQVFPAQAGPAGAGLQMLLGVAASPMFVIVGVVVNIVGTLLCAFLAPKMAKAFFNGADTLGIMAGGMVAAAVAGADVAARTALPAAGQVGMAGLKAAGAGLQRMAADGTDAGGTSEALEAPAAAGNSAGRGQSPTADVAAGLNTAGNAIAGHSSLETRAREKNGALAAAAGPGGAAPDTAAALESATPSGGGMVSPPDGRAAASMSDQSAGSDAEQGSATPSEEPPVIDSPASPRQNQSSARGYARKVARGLLSAGAAMNQVANSGVGRFVTKTTGNLVKESAFALAHGATSGGSASKYIHFSSRRSMFRDSMYYGEHAYHGHDRYGDLRDEKIGEAPTEADRN